MFKYEFGDLVKDIYTGFIGKVIGKCEYATGEISYLLADIDATGRPIEEWVHENRLNLMGGTNV